MSYGKGNDELWEITWKEFVEKCQNPLEGPLGEMIKCIVMKGEKYMKDFIQLKMLENAFRRYGIESEDAFYALTAKYLEFAGTNGSKRLSRLKNKGSQILKRAKKDEHLIGMLDKIVKSDPLAEDLPIWYQHFLGRRFREASGKFFTPRPIASAMARLLPVSNNAVIMDPTCGSGTFLVEASKVWNKHLYNCKLIGNDVDPMLADLTEIVLSFGTPKNYPKSLTVSNIYEPDQEIQDLFGKIDYILANPPFSLRLDLLKYDSKLFSLGYKTSDALFIDLALKLLRPGGRLVCLLPHSITANKEYDRLRKSVEEDWDFLGVIILPEGSFHLTAGTTTRPDIVMLRKKDDKPPSSLIFCNAPSIGIPLNTRKKQEYDNALEEIVINPKIIETLGLSEGE